MTELPDFSAQLETAKTIEERSTRLIKCLFFLIGIGVVVLALVCFLQVAEASRSAVVYLIPVWLLATLVFSVKLCKQAPASTSGFLLTIGLFSILGGIAFDIIATILHSPTLAGEDNVIVVGLFRTGHSAQFVYLYGFICQALFAAVGGSLWVAFVKHRPVLLTLMFSSQPKSFWEFTKACLGGQYLTWRQFLLPVTLKELFSYKPYPLFWFGIVLFACGSLHRWYLGLEWFGLVPWMGSKSVIPIMLLAVIIYIIWLWSEYKRWRNSLALP